MPDLAFDFVYSTEGDLNFLNLGITLSVVENDGTHQYELLIESENEVDDKQIIDIITDLNKKKFGRMHLDMQDCRVVVSVKGARRNIKL